MSKEKQILHMLLDGYSQRCIASTLCVSRNTVAKVAKAASDHQLSKDALESMEEMEIHNTLFPEEALLPTLVTPDFPYMLMLSLAVMIPLCHADMKLPGYLSWNVPFDGADNRPITEGISSYIHALPAL